MPYTKEELSNVGFYNNFIDKLRSEYLSVLVNRALNFFRDDNDVLYSFEDISTRLGIEDAVLNNNPEYSTLETELNRTEVEEQTGYTDFKKLIEVEIADPLPDGLENGNTITTNNPNDPRKWLIDNNQKRPFPDLQSFYAFEGDWKKVKTLSDDVIDSIPEGEPV